MKTIPLYLELCSLFLDPKRTSLILSASLQEQVEEMKKKEERMEKQMNEIMAENKRLTEPLQKAREEVEELRKQVICALYDTSIVKASILTFFSLSFSWLTMKKTKHLWQ